MINKNILYLWGMDAKCETENINAQQDGNEESLLVEMSPQSFSEQQIDDMFHSSKIMYILKEETVASHILLCRSLVLLSLQHQTQVL